MLKKLGGNSLLYNEGEDDESIERVIERKRKEKRSNKAQKMYPGEK